MLEKVVKASGDECVTGYVRFRRIKKCEGYGKAKKRAARHLSKIKGGRLLDGRYYAAVVRFRLVFYLIPLLALFVAGIMIVRRQSDVRAMEIRPAETAVIEPDETIPDMNMESMYAGLYISVPGFSDMTWDDGGHGMTVYNPEKNECVMRYIVEASGKKIAESKELMPGEGEKLDFMERLEKGIYELDIIALSHSVYDDTPFNSVYQQITLTVY